MKRNIRSTLILMLFIKGLKNTCLAGGVNSTFQSWYQVATTPRWTWWTLHKWRSLSTRSRTRLILVTTFAITRADHNHHNHHQPNNINHHHQYHPPSQTRLTKVTTNLYYHQNIRAMLSNMQMWGSLWIKEVWAFNTYHPWLLSKKRPASLFFWKTSIFQFWN